MKSYTDLEQSKKLAEILPFESADMYYYSYMSIGEPFYMNYPNVIEDRQILAKNDIPCWSLAALLNILPSATLDSSDDGYYRLHYKKKFTEWYDNPIDVCISKYDRKN